MPGQCCMCGKPGDCFANDKDRWVRYKPIYTKETRRFLCEFCRGVFSPGMVAARETKDQGTLRLLPYEEDGSILPTVFREQMEAQPWTFPLRALCEAELFAEIIGIFQIVGGRALRFRSDTDSYWIRVWQSRRGHCDCFLPTWQSLPQKSTLHFSGYYKERGYQCVIQ